MLRLLEGPVRGPTSETWLLRQKGKKMEQSRNQTKDLMNIWHAHNHCDTTTTVGRDYLVQ